MTTHQEKSPVLRFIIPVRHPDNCKDWQSLKQKLSQTIASVSGQDNPDWQAVIVANHGADLPALPARFSVAYVDFPPNRLFEQGSSSQEDFWNAVRIDKGRRVLAGMMAAGLKQADYFMTVDDDDFVSRRLVSFVAAHCGQPGWYIKDGYIWGSEGKLLYQHHDFSAFCGTSLIIRSDIYNLPENAQLVDEQYIREMLGSHVLIKDILSRHNIELAPLPFYGAVYRIGHREAHSRSPGLIRKFLLTRDVLWNPLRLPRRLLHLRYLEAKLRHEFWGAA